MHVGAEASAGDGHAEGTQRRFELDDPRFRFGGRRGVGEAGAPAA